MIKEKILAFFEDKFSLSFNVWIKELKNGGKVVYLRPFIKISNPTQEDLEIFLKHFDINNKNIITSVVSSKKINKHYTINIQTMDDAEVFVAMYKEYIFITERVRSEYERFVKCFDYVKEIGSRHTVYKDEISKFVDLKFEIHHDIQICISSDNDKKLLINKIKEALGDNI